MILITVFQPIINSTPASGVGKIAYRLFLHLKKSENIQIIFSSKGNVKDPDVRGLGVIFRLFNRMIGFFNRFLPYYIIRYTQELLFDLFLYFKITSEIEVLITTNAWIPISAKKAKRRKIKIIFIAGNPNDNLIYDILRSEKQKLGILKIDAFDYKPRLVKYNRFLKNVDHIVCINKYIYESFEKKETNSVKTHLIPTIFDADFKNFNVDKNEGTSFVIFYCAHTTTLKGLHLLLEAFNLFQRNKKNVQLLICGGIDKGLSTIIDKMLNGNTIFLGSLSNKKVAKYFELSSVFVVPSLTDAAPVSMIEAMYSKTPVICSNGVGHQWLIKNGYNGYIYNKHSVKDLVNKLNLIYSLKNKISVLGNNARKTIDDIYAKNENFYIAIADLIE